jgi:endonuclease YncB( thermonuclease family)
LGNKALLFTGDLAAGNIVTVKPRDKDRYGGTVAEIILPDGKNLRQELVRAGLAWWYSKYAPNDAPLRNLEKKAR